jgi:hypothetical protein
MTAVTISPKRNYVLVTTRHAYIQGAILFWGTLSPDDAPERSFAGYTNNFDRCERYTRDECEEHNRRSRNPHPFYGEGMPADSLSWVNEDDFFIEISRLEELSAKPFNIYYRV